VVISNGGDNTCLMAAVVADIRAVVADIRAVVADIRA
jgi:hypothetical protein